jgi:hypothetical protein
LSRTRRAIWPRQACRIPDHSEETWNRFAKPPRDREIELTNGQTPVDFHAVNREPGNENRRAKSRSKKKIVDF